MVDSTHCSHFIYEFFSIAFGTVQDLHGNMDFIQKLSLELLFPKHSLTKIKSDF